MAKEFETVEIGVGEGVDLRFGIKDCQTGLIGGNYFIVQCSVSGQQH